MDSGLKKGHNPNPRTNANIFSVITFWWVLDIFKLGYKKDLEIEDLYDALQEHRSDCLAGKLEKLWNQELQQAEVRKRKPSFLKVLVRCFGGKALWLGLFMAITEFMFQMTQPIFLGGLIRYFSQKEVDRYTAYMYAAGIIVCSTFNVFIKNPLWLAAFHTGMKMRVGACSLIYRKALRLSKTALGETTVGQTVNLLSNDVARFDKSFLFLPFLFIGPAQTALIVYFMWNKIGISAIIGVATILLFIPVQAGLGKRVSTLRMRTAKRTDERIRFMNEIIIGIQVIKMYAWEIPFAHLIALARNREIRAVRATCFMRGLLFSFGRFGTKIAIFVSIVTYVLLVDRITAEQMFVVTAYFNIMKQTMTEFFPLAITEMAESSVSIKRIQAFLLRDEAATAESLKKKYGKIAITSGVSDEHYEGRYSKNDSDLTNGSLNSKVTLEKTQSDLAMKDRLNEKAGGDPTNNKCIRITNVTAKWTEDFPENTLTNVNLDVKPGGLVAVIGPVGSGKTSLLHAILKELPLSSGSILVGGSISYASQEPWLFTGSVRQNILFGQPMDRDRYRQVVRVCALGRDFQLLPHGDKTIVGERGVTLSGGQRARINLARAVYKQADVYLLDDPLSAVDTHVGRHLFDDCIYDFLQGKTRVLVTHQLQYLHTAHRIVILNNGKVEATGTFPELQESGLDFARQLDLDAGDNKSLKEGSDEHSNLSRSKKKVIRQNSDNSQVSSVAGSEPMQMSEMRTRGRVSSSVYRSYFAAGGNFCFILVVFALCMLAQLVTRSGDYWMAYWTNMEELRVDSTVYSNEDSLNMTSAPFLNVSITSNDFTSSTLNMTDEVVLDVNMTSTLLANSTPFLNNRLPVANETEWDWMLSTETCIYVYIGLILAIVFLTIISAICFFNMCMRASVRLHDGMFASITRATMVFFNKNPSGQILNRFTKDMGSIDESLPHTMLDCVQIGLALLGVVVVVAIVNVWLMIPTVLMFIMFYILRNYYLSTSRSLKRLEAITRSPVFSHLSASLQGLATIRAFGAQGMLEKEFDNHQDLHSSVWYVFIASNRAFGLWLDSVCLIYIALVTLSFLITDGVYYGGDVGLAITQAIMLTGMLQWGIRQSAEMENQMTSVERVLEYTEVEKEPPLESPPNKKPPDSWPSQGEIVFDQVFLAYSKDEPSVLRNVNFVIKAAEKVGIVGRTGAGKSSLITALFHMVELSSGSIQIDGVDILPIGLHDLRSKISIIPQEPTLFSGPLRDNLDPFNEFPDEALWAALAEVELKQVIDELPAGLSHKVSEGGSNFSVGQRQLLCLARAIIRNNKILVLDEATANVDPQTDELIQETIRLKFADCTVLTIAHRLHTVMDSDRILVMDAGSVVEFDHPCVLLKNEIGYLYKMVQQTGHAMAESLLRVAQESYEKNMSKEM